jgi:hypothetical protein
MISSQPRGEVNSDRGNLPPNMALNLADDLNVVAVLLVCARGPLQVNGIER